MKHDSLKANHWQFHCTVQAACNMLMKWPFGSGDPRIDKATQLQSCQTRPKLSKQPKAPVELESCEPLTNLCGASHDTSVGV